MSAERALVTNLNRSNATATVRLAGGAEVEAMVLGPLPPPRSIAIVEEIVQPGSGQWAILGYEGAGAQRNVVTEDFNGIVKGPVLGFHNAVFADTLWAFVEGAAGTVNLGPDLTIGTGTPRRQGQGILTSGAAVGQWILVYKGILNAENVTLGSQAPALWCQTTVAIPTVSSAQIKVGLSDRLVTGVFAGAGAGAFCVDAIYDSNVGANWLLRTRNGATEQVTDTLIPVVANKFVELDLIWLPGAQAALYVDGQLGAISIVGIPPADTTARLQAALGVYPRAAAARTLIIDRYALDIVGTLTPFT